MIQNMMKEKRRIWVLIAYIAALVVINNLLINKFPTDQLLEKSMTFSVVMFAKLLIVMVPFIVIEERIMDQSKWKKRLIRINAVFLVSLACTWFIDMSMFYCNYFILWLSEYVSLK